MRVTATAKRLPKNIIAQAVPLPAPVGGLDAISPLANMPIDRAIQMDNWIPRPGWIEPRKGYITWSTIPNSSNVPVQTVMSYNEDTGGRKLFAVAGNNIYDCTNKGTTATLAVSGLGSSRLQYTMFSNPADNPYLITVDGSHLPWVYNGTSWSQPTISIGNAQGTIAWSVNMVPGETINLNGTIVTFVSGAAVGNQVQIQGTLAGTLASLVTFLNSSADVNIQKATYSAEDGTLLRIIYDQTGNIGNDFTIAAGYASGTITFFANPANGDTITLQGTSITFVSGIPTGNQIKIESTITDTLASLLTFLTGSDNSSFTQFTYVLSSNVLRLTATAPGFLGNALLIGASAATASGSTLTGGSSAAASGTNLTGGSVNYGVSPNTFVHVNTYMNRLWFVPENSTNVVYLQTVGAVSGAASVFPLGQLMRKGGYIMAIGTWTVDTRQSVDEYIAFITSRGEVMVYQGSDPSTATTFALTGIYQIGAPIGRRCFLRIAGNMQVITVDGIVGMSEMLSTDRGAANRVSLTSIIMNQIALSAQQYKNNFGWQLIEYPLGTLAILNVPVQENNRSIQYVMNTITGAWCRFIGLDGDGDLDYSFGINSNCWEIDAFDNIYFGGNDGKVYQWNVGSSDGANPITCLVKTAYNNFGNGAQLKRYTMLQPLITTTGNPVPSIGINVDFKDLTILSTAQPENTPTTNWNEVNWNQFSWPGPASTTDSWVGVQGLGHYVSIVTQVTIQSTPSNPTYYPTLQLNGWNITAEQGAFV